MEIQGKKNISKMMIVLFMLSIAGFVLLTGSSAFAAEECFYDTAYNLTDIDEPPRVIRVPALKYPFEAAKEGIEGRVVIRLVVDSDGKAQEPDIVESDPEGIFDETALETIVKYKFKPAVKDGKNVDCIVRVPVKFEMGQFDKEAYSTIYKLDEVDQPPKPVYMAPPEYPSEAASKKISGRVVLQFVVAPDGWACESQVISAEPEGVFEEAALDALADYRFQPALKDGKPVACTVKMPVNFDIDMKPPGFGEDSDQKVMIKKDVWKQ